MIHHLFFGIPAELFDATAHCSLAKQRKSQSKFFLYHDMGLQCRLNGHVCFARKSLLLPVYVNKFVGNHY
jgi:hypothetical protein